MKHKLVFLLASLLLFLFSSSGFAAQYFDVYNVEEAVTGGEMGGLKVTSWFQDFNGRSVSSTAYWTQDFVLGVWMDSGRAENDDFVLSQNFDTFFNGSNTSNNWKMENTSGMYMTSFKLEGFYQEYEGELFANIVFDILNDAFYTPGSDLGYVHVNPPNFDNPVTAFFAELDGVTYRGTLTEDLYASVMISFSGSGLESGDSFKFYLDTDKVSAVPIPGAFLLLGSGLLCLVGIKRRSR